MPKKNNESTMRNFLLIKVLLCAFSGGGVLYAYLEQQNDVTKLRIQVPKLAREVRIIEEKNTQLRYQIERFENPKHLMTLAKRPEYSHLKHPTINEILVAKPGPTLEIKAAAEPKTFLFDLGKPSLVLGSR